MFVSSRFFSQGLCLLATACLFAPSSHAQQVEAQRPAVEVTARGGLPNVLTKLKSGGDVRIGYLGGSITAAPGWRVKSLKWLQEQYPKAKLSEINAAIGGTGSDLGVFRAGQDVLAAKPDLLFVEFAVNDGGAEPAQIQRCMEGIVRQTWKANPATDICFVYTLSEPFLADLKAGKISRSATAMEGVADHYKIPSIHFGLEVASLEKDGKLTFKGIKPKADAAKDAPMVFSEDGVHPLVETGHELYLKAITRSWPALQAGKVGPHALTPPLRADNWENAKLLPISKDMLKGSWTLLDPFMDARAKSFCNRLPQLWKASKPGDTLEFAVNGTVAFAYDLVGPDGGLLDVQVDDQPVRSTPRIDAHCTYHRLAKTPLLMVATPGKHHVKVTLSDKAPDKAKILFEKNRPDLEKNPAKYADNVWYVGGLLILGDLVK